MIYQTDKEFTHAINKWGCYLVSLLTAIYRRLNIFSGLNEVLTYEKVVYVMAKGIDAGAIDKECTVLNPQWVCDFVAPNKFKFNGKVKPDHKVAPDEFVVECWFNDKGDDNPANDFTHFTLPDYDPIQGGSQTKKFGKLVGYRLFTDLVS